MGERVTEMAQTVNILDASGKKSGTLDVSDRVLGAPSPPAVIRQALNQYLACQRQGTHATKSRGMIQGSKAKPWKQKGTGRARAGSRKSPLWRSGGVIFGPSPRSYRQRLNKKMRTKALTAVISDFQREGRLFVIEEIEIAEPKTRLMVEYLERLGVEGRILLLFDPGAKTQSGDYAPAARDIFLAARNLPYATPLAVNNLNVFDLLSHDCLVISKAALQRLEEAYG